MLSNPCSTSQALVTHWLDGLKACESVAAQELWNHYFARLVAVAQARLKHVSPEASGEDIALSALKSVMLDVTLQVDALCDEFESAFDGPEIPLLAPFVDRVDPDGRTHLLEELVALAMEHLQKHGIKDAAGALLQANESLRDDLIPLIPDAAVTTPHPPRDPNQPYVGRGLHVRCPHCHNPIELVPDGDLESVHCESCGSDFSLTSEGTETRAAREVTQIGHFKLVERIGMGAFGSVWKALDLELDRTVAVKIPRHGNLQQDAFLREARAAAQLHHPNIVPVHENPERRYQSASDD